MLSRYWLSFGKAARRGLIATLVVFCLCAANEKGKNPPPETKNSASQSQSAASITSESMRQSGAKNSALLPASEIKQPDNKCHKCETQNEKEGFLGYPYEGMIAWSTIFLTIATFILGWFTYLLWQSTLRAIRDSKIQSGRSMKIAIASAKASQKSAKAAENAIAGGEAMLQHARESSEKELRAYVFVTSSSIVDFADGVSTIHLTVENLGKTPAYKVRIYQDFSIRAFDMADEWTPDIEKVVSKKDLGPSAKIPISDNYIFDVATIMRIHEKTEAFFIFGEIRYCDAFGERRTTKYRLFLGGPKGIYTAKDDTGKDIALLNVHQNGNESD